MSDENKTDRIKAVAGAAIACALLLAAGAAHADNLGIENVTVAPRDAKTATVRFDISWENSWRHGSFHDAAWVFFKIRPEGETQWQHVKLVADKVANPTGYRQGEGTPVDLIVPDGEDGFTGMFVRRAAEGKGALAARNVTALWDFTASEGITRSMKNVQVRGFGIEMVYVAEGPFYLGSGGTELNRFYMWTDGGRDIAPRRIGPTGWERQDDGQGAPAYRVTSAGAIPTGRQKGKLWAAGIMPEDGGEIPEPLPNGYAAFYCMKYCITQGQYADFLNTLTETQAKERFHVEGHGRWIDRAGECPNYTYSASGRLASQYGPRGTTDRDERCPWLSWADGAALAAWAGLRPMTELEYEKAIRGPRDPEPNDKRLRSYWGIPEINTGYLYERPVTVGNAVGRMFAGTHGRGAPTLPVDWPADVGGAVFRGNYLHGYPHWGEHMGTSGRSQARHVYADRNIHPFGGWRGVRSAPSEAALAVEPTTGRFDPRSVRPVARLDRLVRVDGVLDEWSEPALILNRVADVFPVERRFSVDGDWQGPKDLGAKVYFGSDGEALCVAAEVTDDRHFNAKTGDSIAGGDALQIGLVTAEGVDWNIGLALTQAGIALHQSSGEGDTLMKTAGCAVVRDDEAGVTRYELRLPWAALGLNPGDAFGFNVVFVDDDDGNGQTYRLQLAPDPTGGSNSALYPRLAVPK